ncbi:SMP protein, partial [Galbula dea]|nr:SMP protein [Galbula dea]
GQELELSCEAEGSPLPLLSWFRQGALLSEEAAARGLRLRLPHVSPGDAGDYQCVAENRHGRHNRSLQLHVA